MVIEQLKIFLASSSELEADRREFEIFVNRKNKLWAQRGVLIKLVQWEDFLDAVSKTRLQDEYNQAIRDCDLFVMLFHTKVGPYTGEEFEVALAQFRATGKPLIFTYFKTAQISLGGANDDELLSLLAFKKKLSELGHFHTPYDNVEGLKLHFTQQLDKLIEKGFVAFERDQEQGAAAGSNIYPANLTGDGAIAQGEGAQAVGASGVLVGGKQTGDINTGTKIVNKSAITDTGGGAYVGGSVNAGGDFIGRDKITYGSLPAELELLFVPLLEVVAQQAAPDKRVEAEEKVEVLKTEVAKGVDADDGVLARIIDGLVTMVPGAVGTVVSLFATPILKDVAGNATRFVLEKLRGG